MRNLFPGYYRPTEEQHKKLWTQGIFVFDTNVLLNLYSYPEQARKVFISVLNKITDRIWIPYQVALEFHRNRFPRIKQANERVVKLLNTIGETGDKISSEVNSIELEKRNIGIDDIQDRLTAVQNALKQLSEAVQLACEKLPPVSLDDPIGDEISSLFAGKVGEAPTNQEALENLLLDASDRYDKKIPPGYEDIDKKETYRDNGISYSNKYGDLILWKQLLTYAKDNEIKEIVFITGDRKKDWWWLEDGRILGPLPELVQEISGESNVELFWMYSSDQFLVNAETYLKATEVTPETIEQVKVVSDQKALLNAMTKLIKHKVIGFDPDNISPVFRKIFERNVEDVDGIVASNIGRYIKLEKEAVNKIDAVENWLRKLNSDRDLFASDRFPTYLVEVENRKYGYEVIWNIPGSNLPLESEILNVILKGYSEVVNGRLDKFTIIVVLDEDEAIEFLGGSWNDRLNDLIEQKMYYPDINVFIGVVKGKFFNTLYRL